MLPFSAISTADSAVDVAASAAVTAILLPAKTLISKVPCHEIRKRFRGELLLWGSTYYM